MGCGSSGNDMSESSAIVASSKSSTCSGDYASESTGNVASKSLTIELTYKDFKKYRSNHPGPYTNKSYKKWVQHEGEDRPSFRWAAELPSKSGWQKQGGGGGHGRRGGHGQGGRGRKEDRGKKVIINNINNY
ncbi:uncharacterized protein LOC136096315 [Hydra vulgaris]|uniref:uncharacterized protein LOC136096315 n=1 Tax=Hydra vulgaris TaxID=6087 RepID=UPI0032E9D933